MRVIRHKSGRPNNKHTIQKKGIKRLKQCDVVRKRVKFICFVNTVCGWKMEYCEINRFIRAGHVDWLSEILN